MMEVAFKRQRMAIELEKSEHEEKASMLARCRFKELMFGVIR